MKKSFLGIIGAACLAAFAALVVPVQIAEAVGPASNSTVVNDGNRGGSSGASEGSGATTGNGTGSEIEKVPGGCGDRILGFRPWYDGICSMSGSEVVIDAPKKCDAGQTDDPTCGDAAITTFVWTIVLNILFDVSLAIGYIALVMVIYGGYMIIMSQGDPSKMAKGKKTLMAAVIGTVIAVGASVIVNTIIEVLGINKAGGWQQNSVTVGTRINNALGWAYSMAGLVAVIFIIKGGVEFMLSTGDMAKVMRAKHSIIFAAVGLAIVILAAVITNLIIGTAGGAL